MRHCYGHHYITLLNIKTTSGLSILVYDVITFLGEMPYDTNRPQGYNFFFHAQLN